MKTEEHDSLTQDCECGGEFDTTIGIDSLTYRRGNTKLIRTRIRRMCSECEEKLVFRVAYTCDAENMSDMDKKAFFEMPDVAADDYVAPRGKFEVVPIGEPRELDVKKDKKIIDRLEKHGIL
jgi:hypothetical protein